jgi:magnesium-transporting ATPase (P-type)
MIRKIINNIFRKLKYSFFDMLPIVIVVSFFQIFILKQPFPNLEKVLIGLVFVVLGLMLFVEGLEVGLFPIGENISYALVQKGSLFWLLLFSFLLGFSTTIAEPALIAVAKEAAKVAREANLISSKIESDYALGLRLTVAFSVGLAILVGIWRIIKGWPIYYLIIGGYVIVILMTLFAPDEIIGIAYDAGGVTTSTITVPLVTALGVGLATVLEGRSPLTDGFGLIAFASLFPMIFVMAYGMIVF